MPPFDVPRQSDLIFDIGMHRCEDTEFYLKKGFRVVAVEANPSLVREARMRFDRFVGEKRLTIVEGAIVDPAAMEGRTKVRFHRNDERSEWGTVVADWAHRNASLGASSTIVEVDAVDMVDLLNRHGIPYYMKIDIEGADILCVEALRQFRLRPAYISLESDKKSFGAIDREIRLLNELGYDAFQAVEQESIPYAHHPPIPAREGTYSDHRFVLGSSGLFGAELAPEWMDRRAVLRRYRVIMLGYKLLGDAGVMNPWSFPGAEPLRRFVRRALRRATKAPVPGWYDTHARHSSVFAESRPGTG
jgi:FkbM family methyltransferase